MNFRLRCALTESVKFDFFISLHLFFLLQKILTKWFIKAVYQSGLSKRFIKTVYQNGLSKRFIKTVFRNGYFVICLEKSFYIILYNFGQSKLFA